MHGNGRLPTPALHLEHEHDLGVHQQKLPQQVDDGKRLCALLRARGLLAPVRPAECRLCGRDAEDGDLELPQHGDQDNRPVAVDGAVHEQEGEEDVEHHGHGDPAADGDVPRHDCGDETRHVQHQREGVQDDDGAVGGAEVTKNGSG